MKKLLKNEEDIDFGAWIQATVAWVGVDKTRKIKEEYELILEFQQEHTTIKETKK